MFGSEILDVSIGLILVYLLLSLISSAITELIESFRKKRASDLERGIRALLSDSDGKDLTQKLYKHPLIAGLFLDNYDPSKISSKGRYRTGSNLPSYIPSRNFALALIDTVLNDDSAQKPAMADGEHDVPNPAADAVGTSESLESLRKAVEKIENKNVQAALRTLIDAAGGDLDKVRENIEAWYDSTMDRVSGWYTRYTQAITLLVGLSVTLVVNADTIAIGRSLAQDDSTREAMLAVVQDYVGETQEQENQQGQQIARQQQGQQYQQLQQSLQQAQQALQNEQEAQQAVQQALDQTQVVLRNARGLQQQTLQRVQQDLQIAQQALENDGQQAAQTEILQAQQALQEIQRAQLIDDLNELQRIGLPLGWTPADPRTIPAWNWRDLNWADFGRWLLKVLGWLITALAISLGASFWFDLLNKFMIVRSTVKPYEKSPPEPPIDRSREPRVVVELERQNEPRGNAGRD